MEKLEANRDIYVKHVDVIIKRGKARKAMCIILYAVGKMSINKIAKIFGMCWSLIYRWINEAAEKLPNYKIKDDVKEIKLDEMRHFLYKKTQTMDNQGFGQGQK